VGTIWRRQDDEWQQLAPSGFPSEEKLHDLVEGSPGLLPLSGSPSVVVLGREVSLGPGYADLVAVEPDGRLVIVEIKLRRNSEARRAVVAQVLTYAAYLKGLGIPDLEAIIRPHLDRAGAGSIIDLVRGSDQSAEIEAAEFTAGLTESLVTGGFRLVVVLDEAPSELVQLVGYLESVSDGIVIDLITVSAYEAGDEQLLVPQRVDPEHVGDQASGEPRRLTRREAKSRREIDGADAFEEAVERSPEADRKELRRLLDWARSLESEGLVKLRTVFGEERVVLTVWVRGEKAGLVSIWNEGGAYLSLWRSVFVRLAWDRIATVERMTGEPIGQGSIVRNPSQELLEVLTQAYSDAAEGPPPWNGRDFYVAFGENDQRSWEEAVRFGFVSAGGGEWYTRSLQQLKPGHRVFVYIPKGNGVGGYVGVGEVTGESRMAKDFRIESDGREVGYLEVTRSPGAAQHLDDPALAEWVVPVRWIDTRSKQKAICDSDFFANQNSAVKLTHGYTLEQLASAFGIDGALTAPARRVG
jgi:hypothetical protein